MSGGSARLSCFALLVFMLGFSKIVIREKKSSKISSNLRGVTIQNNKKMKHHKRQTTRGTPSSFFFFFFRKDCNPNFIFFLYSFTGCTFLCVLKRFWFHSWKLDKSGERWHIKHRGEGRKRK